MKFNRYRYFFFFSFWVVGFSACAPSGNSPQNMSPNDSLNGQNAAIPLPNTPETVVRAWESEIGKNQFTLARLISSGSNLEFVNSLVESSAIEKADETRTEIIRIECSEQGDEALCDCLLRDDAGQVRYKYLLIRQNGQWFLNEVLPHENQPEEFVNEKPSAVTAKQSDKTKDFTAEVKK
jgi:hypothetical protein